MLVMKDSGEEEGKEGGVGEKREEKRGKEREMVYMRCFEEE